MQKTVFDKILEQIACANGVAPAEVREKMRTAMVSALENPSPAVQAMWDSVPRKGASPTLEEFMDYLIDRKILQP